MLGSATFYGIFDTFHCWLGRHHKPKLIFLNPLLSGFNYTSFFASCLKCIMGTEFSISLSLKPCKNKPRLFRREKPAWGQTFSSTSRAIFIFCAAFQLIWLIFHFCSWRCSLKHRRENMKLPNCWGGNCIWKCSSHSIVGMMRMIIHGKRPHLS